MEEVRVPEGLPSLASGKHVKGTGKACVMELMSVLAGEQWSDSPRCVHPVLRSASIVVNDHLPDEHRNLLIPMIVRLFGTGDIEYRNQAENALARQMLREQGVRAWFNNEPLSRHNVWHDLPIVAFRQRFGARSRYSMAGCKCQACAMETYLVTKSDFTSLNAAESAVAWLSDLIDVYDRSTGRTQGSEVTPKQIDNARRAIAVAK
jgi:hypothetical protein